MSTLPQDFEKTANAFPDKVAVRDAETAFTYLELMQKARSVGTVLSRLKTHNAPVAVYMNKTPLCVAAMLGTAYSGNFYLVIDPQMPPERMKRIFGVVHPVAVITEPSLKDTLSLTGTDAVVLLGEEIAGETADDQVLAQIAGTMIDTDPLYCLFTSGSTGVPKGTVITHRNVLTYVEWVRDTFSIDEKTVFGSQTPFYFSMSITDLFTTLHTGAELVIIPKSYFSFPIKLIQYLNDREVNTIYWVPSALSIVANLNLFHYAKPEYLQKVLFAGEVMPTKQLNYWMDHFPDLLYANLFGPTETTDICTYYVVNRRFENGASLPIGNACQNCGVMVINDRGQECAPGEEGELYVRGSFVAAGYYNDPEKTAAVFVQNPLQNAYPETVYKTGDIVKYNELGELLYCGRKDFQIKHMGYRIELGEIENAAAAAEGVRVNACLYQPAEDSIVLVFEGTVETDDLLEQLKQRVPAYMVPNRIVKIPVMPYNQNGKIDRVWLKENLNTI